MSRIRSQFSRSPLSRGHRSAELLEHRLLLAADAFAGDIVPPSSADDWFEVRPASNAFAFQRLQLQPAPMGPTSSPAVYDASPVGDRYIVQIEDATQSLTSVVAVERFFQERIEDEELAPTRVVRGLGQPGVVLVETLEFPEVISPWFANQPVIAHFELDGVVAVDDCDSKCPNDPSFTVQQDALDIVGVSSLWNQSQGSPNVLVGVMDTGVDYTHPDIAQNIWLNQGEIPQGLLEQLVDGDNDGRITFYDLNAEQNSDHVFDRNLNGFIDAQDILEDPLWENGLDEDGNGFRDDLVVWDFEDGDN